MQVSISIEPYLTAGKEKLTRYLDEIINVREQLKRLGYEVSLHFDYFRSDVEMFNLVQKYTNKIDIDLHLMKESAPSLNGFRSVAFDAGDLDVVLRQEDKDMRIAANIVQVTNECRGVVLDLGCELQDYENLIREAKHIIVMTVKCGKSGQPFQASALQLVGQIRRINPLARIIIDGGVNENNVILAKNAGADVVVVGSYAKKCYESGDLKKGINRLLRN